jgi:Ca-activated chloride channel family protein
MFEEWNIAFWEYEYFAPLWFLTLVLLPFAYLLWLKKERSTPGFLKFSGKPTEQSTFSSAWILRVRKFIVLGYLSSFTLLIFALAKPYHLESPEGIHQDYKKGIDIIIALDVSVSMLAMDFEPNRLEASKRVAKQFVDGRRGDRIGLVVYAGEAYTACPATMDHNILKEQIDAVTPEGLDGGTAIGTGLGTAVTRLRNDSLPSRVIILLTDGTNTAGDTDPITAAETARAKGIRVYTIGVGSNGEAPTPVSTPFGIRYENMPVEIDEEVLMKIANLTNGKYFRATDEASLQKIYAEIEDLEKQKLTDKRYSSDPPATPMAFLNWALLLSLLTWVVQRTLFRHEQ